MKRTCSVDGCDGVLKGLGYCGKHYQRFKKYGSPDLPVRERPTCSGPECSRPLDPVQNKTGLCRSHYKQRHLGKPLTPLLIATKDLGRPKVCVVEGCERPHKARGFCKTHDLWSLSGRPLDGPVQSRLPAGPCGLDGCDKPRLVKGVCAAHNYVLFVRWNKYGLTAEQGQALYERQGGACAVCRTPRLLSELVIDHNHECCPRSGGSCGSCVRGLLCGQCNLGLGHFGDNPDRLLSAARYLSLVAAERADDQ